MARAYTNKGKPPLDIDAKVVEGMAGVGATNIEIADFNGCTVDTITNRFSELLSKARAARKIRLRRLQWTAAEGGNIAMQIWLGKQELGQRERLEVPVDEEGKPVRRQSIVFGSRTIEF
jgi:hypothetical protein